MKPQPQLPAVVVKAEDNDAEIQNTIGTINFIDQQRLEVNRQLVALETYRCQLDTIGCHLNQTLIKLLHIEKRETKG